MAHDGFPSRETLAAFFNDELDAAMRRRVVEHMTACTECYEAWVAANRSIEHALGSATTRRRFRRAALAIATMVATILAVLSSEIWRSRSVGPPQTAIDTLLTSARELPFRTVALRLSAPFDYRPLRAVMRSAPVVGIPETWRLSGAVAQIKLQADAAPTVENLHALGLSYLMTGYFEHAVETLEQANGAETNAAILTDLAAAYYAAGVKQKRVADIAHSLDLSDAVLAISPRNSAAQFNRALALEALGNRPSALAAWQRYLQLDASSEWTNEARQHVSRLSAPAPFTEWASFEPRLQRLSPPDLSELASVAERFPLQARRAVEQKLLPRWAAARARGDDVDAARVLRSVQIIGSAIQTRFGDPTLADIAQTISAALASGDERRLELLIRGHAAYAQAQEARKHDTDRAKALFSVAWKELREAGSPAAYAAATFAAWQEYNSRRYDEALGLLTELKSERALMRYAPLAGQVFWVEGMALLASGRPHESLQRYGEAVAAYQRSGEIDSVAGVETLIAENLQALGDDDEAWKHRLRALPVVLDFGDARRQQVAFNEAAEAAMQQGRFSAALEYQTASLALAAGSTDDMAAYSYLGRAMILGGKGLFTAARHDVDRARAHAERVSDRSIRANTIADVDMAEALLRQSESPSAAVPLFTRVLEYQRTSGYEFRTAQLLLARGRAHARSGDDTNARGDFRRAIAAIESQREQLPDLRLRSALFGRAEDAYEELTALLVRAGEFEEALRVFDRSCERTLTEVIGGNAIGAAVRAAARTPPDGTAIVEIAVLPDEIVAWTTRRSETSVSRHAIASNVVTQLVASYERAIAADSESVQRIGSRLYDLLVRPLPLSTAGDETIVFVTDRVLHGVPMASLYDAFRKRYLVEDFALVTAPSAEAYWRCVGRLARDRFTSDAVVIGNARTGTLELGLPDLPQVERELRDVAAQWRGRLLLNEQATPGALLAAAAKEAAFVYFAGHAVVNEQDRGRSALVLAPEGQESSALLHANRIAAARLRAQLVVLSACTTNATPARAEGAVDVARAFLAAGVPTVVSSRWEVGDGSARNFLTIFARELARSQSAAEALRRTQLEILGRDDRRQRAVRSWCAFDVIGAV